MCGMSPDIFEPVDLRSPNTIDFESSLTDSVIRKEASGESAECAASAVITAHVDVGKAILVII